MSFHIYVFAYVANKLFIKLPICRSSATCTAV